MISEVNVVYEIVCVGCFSPFGPLKKSMCGGRGHRGFPLTDCVPSPFKNFQDCRLPLVKSMPIDSRYMHMQSMLHACEKWHVGEPEQFMASVDNIKIYSTQ